MKTAILFLALFPLAALAGLPLDVQVQGVDGALKDNVLAHLELNKLKEDEGLNARWLKRLFARSEQQVRTALQPYGYYNPKVSSELTESGGKWLASYQVEAGNPVKISKLDIRWTGAGANESRLQEEVNQFRLKVGDTLDHAAYESGKNELLDEAFALGYAKAKLEQSQVRVDLPSDSAEIEIVVDTGPLYYFGEISFLQDFLDADLLADYVTIQPGEAYSHEALLSFQQNLIASGFFQEVTINPDFDNAVNDRVPMTVILKPITPHKLSFGIGYETDVGPRLSARWEDRLINSLGHSSDLSLKLSTKESKLVGSYSIPVLEPLTDRWVSSATLQYLETPSTTSNTAEIETAFVRRNLEDTHFYKGFALYSAENFQVGDHSDVDTLLLQLGGTVRMSYIDEDIFPQHGYLMYGDLRGSAEALLSDTSFSRIHLGGRYLLGFGDSHRLDMRLELGGAWVDDFDAYPSSLRFFAGGDNSVRGYEYQSLGPEDSDGVVVGGRNLMVGSLQYDFRVAEKWVLDTFVDAGNAYNSQLDKIYVGSGFGARYLAPFGSVRIDFGWPVSEQPEMRDFQIHLGFGATL